MRKDIENIVKNFDYEKVHKVMKALNWKWATADTDSGVPLIGDLVLNSIERMEGAIKQAELHGGSGYEASGGFRATHVEGLLSLAFIVQEWDALT